MHPGKGTELVVGLEHGKNGERQGFAQPEEEKAKGDPTAAYGHLKRGQQEGAETHNRTERGNKHKHQQ